MSTADDQPALQLTVPRRIFVLSDRRHGLNVVQCGDILGRRGAAADPGRPRRHPGRGVVDSDFSHSGNRSCHADDRLAGRPVRPGPRAVLEPRLLRAGDHHVRIRPVAGRRWSFWRLVQGGMGAPIQPLGQSVILDVFPRRQHGLVISIFGTTNTIGPVLGPTVAGYLAETLGWRWAFFMIVPVALLRDCRGLLRLAARTPAPRPFPRLDRFPVALRRHRRDATRAVARPAPRLVRLHARSSLRRAPRSSPSTSFSRTA